MKITIAYDSALSELLPIEDASNRRLYRNLINSRTRELNEKKDTTVKKRKTSKILDIEKTKEDIIRWTKALDILEKKNNSTKLSLETIKGILFRLIGEIRPLGIIPSDHPLYQLLDFNKDVTFEDEYHFINPDNFGGRISWLEMNPRNIGGYLAAKDVPFLIDNDYSIFRKIFGPIVMTQEERQRTIEGKKVNKEYSLNNVLTGYDELAALKDEERLLAIKAMYIIFRRELEKNKDFYKIHCARNPIALKKDIPLIKMPGISEGNAGSITIKEAFKKNKKIPYRLQMKVMKRTGNLHINLDVDDQKEDTLKRWIEGAKVGRFYVGKKGIAFIKNIS